MKRTLVLFLTLACAMPAHAARKAHTYARVGSVYRINATSGSCDLARWTARGGTAYAVSAAAGVLSSTQPGGSAY